MSARHRLVLFVEPYVVRSGAEDFRTPLEIFRDIAAMLAIEGEIDCAIVCNSALGARVPSHVRCYTPGEFGIDEAMSGDWQGNWVKMLNGQNVGRWGEFYRHVVTDFAPTLAYAWNKNSLFQNACRAAGVATITFEYGGVRTPSGFRITVDPRGFGPDSALTQSEVEPREEWSAQGWQWAAEHVYRDALLHRAPHVDLAGGDARGALRVCVLLQKEDDVNFLVWPAFAEMGEFVDRVLERLAAIENVKATVRPHPAGLGDYSKRIATRFPTVEIDDGAYDFSQLVLGYDAVITLNSAGGFEALLCGVPAMSLSEGFYRCAFRPEKAGELPIEKFIKLVREGKFWTAEKRREVGAFTHRLVQNYSIPIDLLRQPAFHRALIGQLGGLSLVQVEAWFAADPANLAGIVRQCAGAAQDLEIAGLRVQNHLRSTADHQLACRLTQLQEQVVALLTQNHRHNEVFAAITADNQQRDAAIDRLSQAIADMTVQNQSRDAAIAQLSASFSEMSLHNKERDAAIAQLAEAITEMTSQNQKRDSAIAQISAALAEMTTQNQQRDAAINHISETLAEMTRHNQQRDQAIQTLSERVPPRRS